MPRRTPPAARRQRDPERTKEKILEAALAEFAEKGYAGARTGEIADRAGVNKQLISYYFGGKEGLRNALNEQWLTDEQPRIEAQQADQPLSEAVPGYIAKDERARASMRLNAWDALADLADYPGREFQKARLTQGLSYIKERQRKGELAKDLDPDAILLALFAVAAAPVIYANIVRDVLEADPNSDEFLDHYTEQVGRMIEHLAGPVKSPAKSPVKS